MAAKKKSRKSPAKKAAKKVKAKAKKVKTKAKTKVKAKVKAKKKAARRLTESAIFKKTGKTLTQWFTVLDEAGARAMASPEIKRVLKAQHKMAGLASQAVANGYKKARRSKNLKKLQATAQGIGQSVTRTLFDAMEKVEGMVKKS